MSAVRSLRLKLAEPRIANWVMLAIIVLLTFLALRYVHQYLLDSISRDEWRFVEILRHWYGGSFSFADIWSTNTAGSEHRVPAFKLYFALNAAWFGLDVRLGCFLGVLALGAFIWLTYRYFLRTRPTGGPAGEVTALDHYAFLPVALTMISFTQSHIYTYDLLAVFTIIGSMLFAALWMQMDLKLREPQPLWRYALYAVLLLALLLSFGAGKNPALVLATLLLAVGIALQVRGGKSVAWKVLAWIAGGALLAELIYFSGGGGKEGSHLGGMVANVLGDPAGALQYVLHALGAAFLTTDGLFSLPEAERPAALSVYGAIVLVGAVVALAVYLWSRGYRRALLPLILAVFAAGYLGELVVGRFGGGTENGGAPRYVYTDHLLIVGCVFVFADALSALYHAGRRRAAVWLLTALTLGVGYVEVHNYRVEHRSIDAQLNAQVVALGIARARLAGGQTDFPRWYCPDQKLCDADMQFLAEHHLSLMRDQAPAAADAAKP